MFYMCIEYHILVNMYHVSTQCVDERMINVHYYYYYYPGTSNVNLLKRMIHFNYHQYMFTYSRTLNRTVFTKPFSLSR